MELIGDWEKLRISNSFSEAQKEIMRDNSKEFSIEKVEEKVWNWWEIHSNIFTHNKKVRQPGGYRIIVEIERITFGLIQKLG